MKTSPSQQNKSTFTLLVWAVVCCAIGGVWLLFNSRATLQLTLTLSSVYFMVCIALSLISARRGLSFLAGFFRLGQLLFLYMGLQCAGHIFGWPGARGGETDLTLLLGASPLMLATLGAALWAALLAFGRNSAVGGIGMVFLFTMTLNLWRPEVAAQHLDPEQAWKLRTLIQEGITLLAPVALLALLTLTPLKQGSGGRAGMSTSLGLILYLGGDIIGLTWSLLNHHTLYHFPPHVQWLMLGLYVGGLILGLQLRLYLGALVALAFICWQANELTFVLGLPEAATAMQLTVVTLGVICLILALLREYRNKALAHGPAESAPLASGHTQLSDRVCLLDELNRRCDAKR